MTAAMNHMTADVDPDEVLAREIRQASEAEGYLIQLMLEDNGLYRSTEINADWFTGATWRKAYRAIGSLVDAGLVADHVSVSDQLQAQEPKVQWLELLVDLHRNHIARPESIDTYVALIVNTHTNRRARRIAQQLFAGAGDGQTAIDTAIRDLMDLGSDDQRHEYSAQEVAKAAIELTEEAFQKSQRGELVGITTGLVDLDNATGGWHDTDLVVIPARPAMGKTALLLNLALNSGVPFGIISSEQAHDQMGTRMLSIEGHVSGSKIRRGKLEGDDWDKLSNGARGLANRQFWINDNPTITIDGIQRQARKWLHTHEIRILFVDYIQRIYPTDAKQPKHQQIDEVTRGLKSLAKELHIPVIALAQVNRECEKRNDKRPGMGDIADASIIEKEADVIGILYRDEVYNPESSQKGIAEIGICKNRHGPTGRVLTKWEGKTFRFENLQLNREHNA